MVKTQDCLVRPGVEAQRARPEVRSIQGLFQEDAAAGSEAVEPELGDVAVHLLRRDDKDAVNLGRQALDPVGGALGDVVSVAVRRRLAPALALRIVVKPDFRVEVRRPEFQGARPGPIHQPRPIVSARPLTVAPVEDYRAPFPTHFGLWLERSGLARES